MSNKKPRNAARAVVDRPEQETEPTSSSPEACCPRCGSFVEAGTTCDVCGYAIIDAVRSAQRWPHL